MCSSGFELELVYFTTYASLFWIIIKPHTFCLFFILIFTVTVLHILPQILNFWKKLKILDINTFTKTNKNYLIYICCIDLAHNILIHFNL